MRERSARAKITSPHGSQREHVLGHSRYVSASEKFAFFFGLQNIVVTAPHSALRTPSHLALYGVPVQV